MDDQKGSKSGKKRKIIHWNPDGETMSRFVPEKKPRRWTFFVVSLCAVLVVAVVAGLGVRYFSGNRGGGAGDAFEGDPNGAVFKEPIFVSRERVERLRAAVRSEIGDIRRITDDHPMLIQTLVGIETAFDNGNRLLASASYPAALAKFEEVGGMVEEMKKFISNKKRATDVYEEFLTLIERYEELRMHSPYEYEKAVAYGRGGTRKLEAGEFAGATLEFNRAIEALVELEEKVELFIADKELAGKIALSAGDKALAEEVFKEILALQPDNELAMRNLERAKNIDILAPLLREAKDFEKNGKLEEALEAYTKAFELDGRSARAQQGKSRVARTIEKNRYNHFKTTGKAAEESGDWDAAVANYEEAVEAFPDKEEFHDALVKAREEGRLAKIEDGLKRAFAQEEQYEWTKARDAFNEVLNLDEGNEEALEGLLRAGNIVRVLIRYGNYLGEARELAQRGEYYKAINNFNEAMSIKPSYLPLDGKARQLQNLLRDQTSPVFVNFISDGKTFVSISGYETIGQFEKHRRKFLPGNYRVRGRRKGYKDVLFELRVRGGKQLPPVKVICYQRI